jgi:hypothetical protein
MVYAVAYSQTGALRLHSSLFVLTSPVTVLWTSLNPEDADFARSTLSDILKSNGSAPLCSATYSGSCGYQDGLMPRGNGCLAYGVRSGR